MIVWSNKIKKSVDIFNSVSNQLLKSNLDLDGVIETFNDGIEQGVILKIYDKFNEDIDICIWAYLPSERDYNNQMKVIVGNHNDCNTNNVWQENLPTKIFTQVRARELHQEVRDYILEVINNKMNKTLEKKNI